MTDHREMARCLLIDADDTLWESNIYFLEASSAFQALMVSLGHGADEAERAQNDAERALIANQGYGPQSYRASLEQAYRRLQASAGQPVSADVVTRCRALAEVILAPPIRLLPGVSEALQALRASSLLVLATKGDDHTQRDKLHRSGLAPLFDHVRVLEEKDEAAYRRLVAELRLDAERTYMVGNGPRSDINPSVAAGLRAIYIPHAHTWVAEREPIRQPERVTQLARFADLPRLFGVA
jgi:putative hydrolase of the HAD superfamily